MADKPVQDIRRNVSSAKRLLCDREILAAAYPEAPPENTEAGLQAQYWHQLSVVVYADQSVSGATMTLIPWLFYADVHNPEDGAVMGAWISGKKIENIPLDYTVSSGPRFIKLPLGVADRVFLQVAAVTGASPNWIRLGIFGDVPRAHSQPQAIVVGT